MNADDPGQTAGFRAAGPADGPALRQSLGELARETGRSEADVVALAARHLRELRTGHEPRVYAWLVRAGRALLGSGYGRIDYDPAQVAEARALLSTAPAVVLSSHKSYLDGGALTVGFHDHRLPPLTVFGGINMSFWPLGTLWRRANMVFIRRGGDDPVYRLALRHTLASLVGQRRPLQWFIEGTRSRTGKLGPPRLGLLVYMVDAYQEGRLEDLWLLPVSINYDQLQEVAEYAGEARGAAKTAESLGWLVRFVRAQRGRFGSVYVRFGEPVSLRAALGPPEAVRAMQGGERRLALQKLAFEVSVRINDATAITGSSLVTLALLGARGHALTLRQIEVAVAGYLDFAQRRGLPVAASGLLTCGEAVRAALDGLMAQGVASAHRGGRQPVYGIAPDRHLAAAYYRNATAHYFLHGAIAELALLGAAEQQPGTRTAAFDAEALELRELLKFDFFFLDRPQFLDSVRAEIGRLAPDWMTRLEAGSDGAAALLARLPTLSSDMLLRSFFEAYRVVVDALEDPAPTSEDELLERCTGLGGQYLLQGRLHAPESVSRHLYRTGLALARHRDAVGTESGAAGRRTDLARRIDRVLRDLGAVHRIAVRRVERALRDEASA